MTMQIEGGGGASRSTEPAAGASSATDVSLREFIEQRFVALEDRLDDRREADQQAVRIAKETADAALEAHNQLIKRMEAQGIEAQRQLDKLTATYATKGDLKQLETLLDQRLVSLDQRAQAIENAVGATSTTRLAVRGVWSDLKSAIVLGFAVLAGIIGLLVYLSSQP